VNGAAYYGLTLAYGEIGKEESDTDVHDGRVARLEQLIFFQAVEYFSTHTVIFGNFATNIVDILKALAHE
jgi:hypothetical protein